jgi:hypothetical protein
MRGGCRLKDNAYMPAGDDPEHKSDVGVPPACGLVVSELPL